MPNVRRRAVVQHGRTGDSPGRCAIVQHGRTGDSPGRTWTDWGQPWTDLYDWTDWGQPWTDRYDYGLGTALDAGGAPWKGSDSELRAAAGHFGWLQRQGRTGVGDSRGDGSRDFMRRR